METLIAGVAGVVVGAMIENIAYYFKRKSEKMVELSDDLVELLLNLELLYRHSKDRAEIGNAHIKARRLLIRILRYRQSFWQRAYNKSLFDEFDQIEQYEAPKARMDFYRPGDHSAEIEDWSATCEMRAKMIAGVCARIEKINPFF